MPAYMPQQVFNMCAVTAAKLSAGTDQPLEAIAAKFSEDYSRAYQDEGLPQQIVDAATMVSNFMRTALPPDTLIPNLTQMQFCIKYYEPSGEKIPRRLFGGTRFYKEPTSILEKDKKCVANIMTSHMLVLSGKIPLAPDNWSL